MFPDTQRCDVPVRLSGTSKKKLLTFRKIVFSNILVRATIQIKIIMRSAKSDL